MPEPAPPVGGLRGLLRYLLGKRSELEALGAKDALLAKAILDVHRKKTGKRVVAVPLAALHPVHVIDREEALRTTAARAAVLREHRAELLAGEVLTQARLAELLPSVSWIKVVEAAPGAFVAFEGNGRIAAMAQVFAPEERLAVEVERYDFTPRARAKVVRRLERARRRNGLPPVAELSRRP